MKSPHTHNPDYRPDPNRYYKSGLIYPNEMTIDIIWSYFQKLFFDQSATQNIREIGSVFLAGKHIPFDPLPPYYQYLKLNQLKKIEHFAAKYTEVNFEKHETKL